MNIPMKRLIATALLWALFQSVACALQETIKLSGSKETVVNRESRKTVLEVGNSFFEEKDDAFVAHVAELTNPYGFPESEVDVEAAPVPGKKAEAPEARPVVTYDDASVLEVVAMRFARQVRGSIARGETSFLQIDGGSLLKPGTSFPVKIPQAEDQSFILKISEISPDGYTLQIGGATKAMTYENQPSNKTGRVRFTD
jgi:hypothetical protein